ncbi:hypothetical protein [Paenibacillus sp. Soil724D2]|uniref:hypothetical protein n=1 Tax=Paenibacillus sp. (strain Soil724D2) TaxID=1736392 RepID=UPI000715A7E6|nr:hypothetical protein [Paenibacillus sp. Soil724D2]KRE48410.1 hypothetical protein ASG85_05245 [Paenibacillus sp. Soil724D2]
MTILGIEAFIQSGAYRELKHLEEKSNVLKCLIRDKQSALRRKRMVWTSIGVVGQFQINKTYEYNFIEMNEYLYDLGILPKIASINGDLLSQEQEVELKRLCTPGKSYVRYTPNRVGRDECHNPLDEYNHYLSMSLSNKVSVWKDMHLRKSVLNNAWERERKQAVNMDLFHISSNIPIKTGSLSLIKTLERFQAAHVLQLFGPNVLVHCARVDYMILEEYAARGYLKKSDLNSFRKTLDIQESYHLMTMRSENARRRYWDSKVRRLSKLSQLS